MDDFELIFTMLGERVTTPKNKTVAQRGGSVAGKARAETEKEIGRSVVSKKNYLKNPESQKQLKAD